MRARSVCVGLAGASTGAFAPRKTRTRCGLETSSRSSSTLRTPSRSRRPPRSSAPCWTGSLRTPGSRSRRPAPARPARRAPPPARGERRRPGRRGAGVPARPAAEAGSGRPHGLDRRSQALPFLGPYAASKHALEVLADVLRVELAPWGIAVSILEPASVKTAIWTRARRMRMRCGRRFRPRRPGSTRSG